jgi:hypothetical protein
MIIQMNELCNINICDTQAFGDGDGGFGCHHYYYTYKVLREGKKKGKKEGPFTIVGGGPCL